VSAALSGRTFSPSSRSVTVPPNRFSIDFTAFQAFSISGSISKFVTNSTPVTDGNGFAGVTVTAGGKSTLSDTNGNYFLTGVAAGSSSVTASFPGWGFDPNPYPLNLTSDTTNVNFVGFFVMSVSGRITENANGIS